MTLRVPGVVVGLLVFVLTVGVGAGAYVVGRGSVDKNAATRAGRVVGYGQGQAAGYRSGVSIGKSVVRAAYGVGQPAWSAIYNKGRRAGLARGKVLGRSSGAVSGFTAGQTAGQNDAFNGYPGGWSVGNWYLVKIGGGDSGARYSLDTRIKVGPSEIYNLCPGNEDNICTAPATP